MARVGMALKRETDHGNTECSDDVKRSIELLDTVLSEFDDVENANQVQNIQQIKTSVSTPQLRKLSNSTVRTASTPEEESPSLDQHSEDDGYMSMNGRKQKFNLVFKPLAEVSVHENIQSPIIVHPEDAEDFPPPPEEAQKLIATLLPKVSPTHKTSGNSIRNRQFPLTQLPFKTEAIPPPQKFQNDYHPVNGLLESVHIATQTTLPKTRHQRPYGWENSDCSSNALPPPTYRFGSLPFQHGMYPISSPTRVPPRTIPTALERHREVRRRGSEDNLSCDVEVSALKPLSEFVDDEHFSDDSLEEILPPVVETLDKRASIAWEVPLKDELFLIPGCTKVIGRRRHKSGSYSSTSSIPNRLTELEDWPDPPFCTTEDEITSPFSDCDEVVNMPPELNPDHLSGTSTYIIRRGNKNRKSLKNVNSSLDSNSSLNSRLSSELSIPVTRFSTDFACSANHGLNTPNSRYSIDLSTPNSRLGQEFNSPKSRFSLDLNSSRQLSQELSSSPSKQSIDLSSSRSSTPHSKPGNDFKKHSTFDNIQSLIKEGHVEKYNLPVVECTSEITPLSPSIVRVVSLPSLDAEEIAIRNELDTTVEEEEDSELLEQTESEISPLRQIEQNISELLERRDIEVIEEDEKCLLNCVESLTKREKHKAPRPPREFRRMNDLQKSNSHNEILRSEDYYRQLLIENGTSFNTKRNGIQKSESAKEMLIANRENRCLPSSTSADFPVHVEIFHHEFPPLPPSPVEEDEDEYSDMVHSFQKNKADTLPTTSESPAVPPHGDLKSSSLKTRSMDANYNRCKRGNFYSSLSRNVPSERRTAPMELQESKRKPFQKRVMHSPQGEHYLQTSCSLPETPIFARGCDIPRTPHRKAPDIPTGNQTAPRQSNTMGNLNTVGNMSTGYRSGTSNSGFDVFKGGELLRLAGGPGRGWYPKQRQRRPASIEHLDRMATSMSQSVWEPSRKPLTLPPNLTPKFFQKSPRDALRRVTSLLIRKGNNVKDPKKEKDILSPTTRENRNGDDVQKRKGFFKIFWKRSRHYSLEKQ